MKTTLKTVRKFVLALFAGFAFFFSTPVFAGEIKEGVVLPSKELTMKSGMEKLVEHYRVVCPTYVHHRITRLTNATFAFRGEFDKVAGTFTLSELWFVDSVEKMHERIAARDGKEIAPLEPEAVKPPPVPPIVENTTVETTVVVVPEKVEPTPAAPVETKKPDFVPAKEQPPVMGSRQSLLPPSVQETVIPELRDRITDYKIKKPEVPGTQTVDPKKDPVVPVLPVAATEPSTPNVEVKPLPEIKKDKNVTETQNKFRPRVFPYNPNLTAVTPDKVVPATNTAYESPKELPGKKPVNLAAICAIILGSGLAVFFAIKYCKMFIDKQRRRTQRREIAREINEMPRIDHPNLPEKNRKNWDSLRRSVHEKIELKNSEKPTRPLKELPNQPAIKPIAKPKRALTPEEQEVEQLFRGGE